MKDLRTARKFRRDLKRITRRGLDRDRLDEVIDLLLIGEPLEEAHRDHQLEGDWKGWRECHIAPDWLLIYQTTEDEVMLARTGSHSDLF